MSKYNALWNFLTYKKELAGYGYEVGKISMKEQTVLFRMMERKIYKANDEDLQELEQDF